MGYVATIVVNVDALHLIKDDKEFGKNVYHAVSALSVKGESGNIPSGGHTSAATAIESHHSSVAVPVLVGGYRDRVIKDIVVDFQYGDDTEMQVLKQLAEKHGFSLRKKPTK